MEPPANLARPGPQRPDQRRPTQPHLPTRRRRLRRAHPGPGKPPPRGLLPASHPNTRLTNLSVRTTLIANQYLTVGFTVQGGGDLLIAGFTITGPGRKNLLIRAAGPSLAPFGVPNLLADPKIELFDSSQTKIGENDNFVANDQTAFASVGAFAFLAGAKDAALIASLALGSYTAVVSGSNGITGNALVEIYELN